MRLRTAAVAASSVVSAGAAAVAAGRYAAGRALRPMKARRDGRGPLPAGFEGPPLTVHSTEPGAVALTRTLTAGLPGVYGLTGRGTHAVVGPVLDDPTDKGAPSTVVRRLDRVAQGQLSTGATVRLTPVVHVGDPGTALGMEFTEVEIPGELGALPAWFVPGDRAHWVIAVHGLGATREHPMTVLPFLRQQRLPVLDIAYRGDPGAPRPLDGLGHLGDSEWRDLDAAIRYALRYGAERVILYGWSSGATMALHAAANSALRDRISGLVLDSPVLDWKRTLRALAAAQGTPRALLPLVVRAVQGRTGLSEGRLAAVAHPASLALPTLLLHGPDDTIAPWAASQALAESRPDLVTLHTVEHAPHAAMWNADPEGYEEALRRFLTPLM
ncbi:alpha/beta hydrolase [Streptomyces albiaxialis]|uniref:alpha/beta hydrolase n=1 Tax=Streptomyces albiaxialis TaxID=329523 RepID=UPI0031E121C5